MRSYRATEENLQREMISPSEKAFAYKMKYETIKRKAGRRKCGQVDHNFGKKSIELIGEECGDSQKQVPVSISDNLLLCFHHSIYLNAGRKNIAEKRKT